MLMFRKMHKSSNYCLPISVNLLCLKYSNIEIWKCWNNSVSILTAIYKFPLLMLLIIGDKESITSIKAYHKDIHKHFNASSIISWQLTVII